MSSVQSLSIFKYSEGTLLETQDQTAVEEPLEISLQQGDELHNVSITMRTPGDDHALAIGFLYTEGIISCRQDIERLVYENEHLFPAIDNNKICLKISDHATVDLNRLKRHFYTSSSCGVCGKASLDAVRTVDQTQKRFQSDLLRISPDMIMELPDRLRAAQEVFDQTGGLHASAFFGIDAELKILCEDVGRHNALDKLIGRAVLNDLLPLDQGILLLSGRASFELIQKAVMAGIRVVAAVGAPSSLAVELAQEFDVTLIGFLKKDRMNIYSNPNRIDTSV